MSTATPGTSPVMWVSGMTAFLNHWFADRAAARAHRAAEGGFLLPYRSQFFVTCAAGIRERGRDPQDPDRERIGWDWARPADTPARERFRARLQTADGA